MDGLTLGAVLDFCATTAIDSYGDIPPLGHVHVPVERLVRPLGGASLLRALRDGAALPFHDVLQRSCHASSEAPLDV